MCFPDAFQQQTLSFFLPSNTILKNTAAVATMGNEHLPCKTSTLQKTLAIYSTTVILASDIE